ncbi:hypothetical protein CHARACLAT_026595 [Characodon lateralis]|uniref:Uncharacterized protein n=1 Tax=Characodon lateralis TaxID=208331 RepID=A0ABU7F7C7_9TELE|nr:hypothetical protein [Characodon lateralis]
MLVLCASYFEYYYINSFEMFLPFFFFSAALDNCYQTTQMAERVKVQRSLTSRGRGNEGPQQRRHQNELLSDTTQKRGKEGACGAAVTRSSDQSIAVPLHIDHN